ncbi:MAG: hypothetical protein CL916_01505 [Deltaproteobacteria bacterium]|nr:hypothetical protein [Deltaproteobacteria bacterium]
MNGTIHILGPQRGAPLLIDIIHDQYPQAKIAVISAGWRHEESQLRSLARDLQRPLELLPLYQWFDDLGRTEPELSNEHALRQKRIKSYKDTYRLKLQYGMEFLQAIRKKQDISPELFMEDVLSAQEDIQKIDMEAMERIGRIRDSFPNLVQPWLHPSAQPFHEEIKETLDACDVLLITGGHVAILRNRMFFFGCQKLLQQFLKQGKTIIAWSAGAMSLCEQIILYYDDPPDGSGNAEVLDTGMGLLPHVLFFPHAQQRLRITDTKRMRDLAQRFSQYQCITLEKETHLTFDQDGWSYHNNVQKCSLDGLLINLHEEES